MKTNRTQPHHYLRERIIKNKYLSIIDIIIKNERNKNIVVLYASGVSFVDLAKKYNITPSRARGIVQNYVIKCSCYTGHNKCV